jgi:hypothetical protein
MFFLDTEEVRGSSRSLSTSQNAPDQQLLSVASRHNDPEGAGTGSEPTQNPPNHRHNGATGVLLPAPRLVALAQMMDGTRRIGAGDVAAARQTATEIAAAYVAMPNEVARRAARAHTLTLLGLLDRASMGADTRTELAAVASDAAALHGHGHRRRPVRRGGSLVHRRTGA